MLNSAPTFGSLFAGVGGFDLGFEHAGMRGLWQVEIDDAARAVLARRFPDAVQYADVREVGAHNLAPVDVICGGFPCQDLSVAGKRAGIVSGARSGLFYEMVRITNELRPAFLVWENVPGLFSSDYGRDFERVLSALAVIGYSGAWTVLDSRYFGLAQRRRRVFGVFARGDIGAGPCAEILSLAARLRWNTAAGKEARKDVAATLGAGANSTGGTRPPGSTVDNAETLQVVSRPLAAGTKRGSGYRNDADTADNLVAHSLTARQTRLQGDADNFIAGTLSANRGGLDRPAGNANELDFCIAAPITASYGKQLDSSDTNSGPPNLIFEPRFARNGRGVPDTIAPPLKAQNGGTGKGDGAPLTFGLMPRRGQFSDGDYSPTVNAGNGGMGAPGVAGRTGVRRLTPVECERLQGFPDGWTDGQADGPRYRQMGNAVSVPVAEWIGRQIVKVYAHVD